MFKLIKLVPFMIWRRVRRILPIPLSIALSECAVEFINAWNHSLAFSRLKKGLLKQNFGNSLNIEIAPADRRMNNWIGIGWGTDYPLDLRRNLPFSDNSVERIYSSHLLEHLTPMELESLLKECFRVLKKEGIFESAIPEVRAVMEAYIKTTKVIPSNQEMIDLNKVAECQLIDELNYRIFCEGEHHIFFDQLNILHYLKKAGFKMVYYRNYDPNIDLESRKDISFYFVAKK